MGEASIDFVRKLTLAARVLGVKRFTADFPQVSVESFLTVGEVLLSLERLLISIERGEVLRASVNRRTYDCEAETCIDLVLGDGSGAFCLLAEVQTVTLVTLGRCNAVGAEEHFGTAVLAVLTGFT